jgi:hypothetical protein
MGDISADNPTHPEITSIVRNHMEILRKSAVVIVVAGALACQGIQARSPSPWDMSPYNGRPPRQTAPAPVRPGPSCEQIYNEILRLHGLTYSHEPAFTENPLNRGIALAGAIFPPAFAFFGYTAAKSYLEYKRIHSAEQRIDALRQLSAQQECFVRQ